MQKSIENYNGRPAEDSLSSIYFSRESRSFRECRTLVGRKNFPHAWVVRVQPHAFVLENFSKSPPATENSWFAYFTSSYPPVDFIVGGLGARFFRVGFCGEPALQGKINTVPSFIARYIVLHVSFSIPSFHHPPLSVFSSSFFFFLFLCSYSFANVSFTVSRLTLRAFSSSSLSVCAPYWFHLIVVTCIDRSHLTCKYPANQDIRYA